MITRESERRESSGEAIKRLQIHEVQSKEERREEVMTEEPRQSGSGEGRRG